MAGKEGREWLNSLFPGCLNWEFGSKCKRGIFRRKKSVRLVVIGRERRILEKPVITDTV
jgi:hypothetical protein